MAVPLARAAPCYSAGMSSPGKRCKRLLLITRPAEDFAATAAAFPTYASICAPCLEFRPVTVDPALRAALPERLALLVTSPRALPALLSLRPEPGWRIFALLPRTAQEVEAAGLPLAGTSEGGAAALAEAATAALPGAPLCFLTSQLGGGEVWRVRPDAIRLVGYATICPERLPEEAVRALAGEYEVLVASPSAVENLERLAPGALRRAARVHVQGRTTEDALRALPAGYLLGAG